MFTDRNFCKKNTVNSSEVLKAACFGTTSYVFSKFFYKIGAIKNGDGKKKFEKLRRSSTLLEELVS